MSQGLQPPYLVIREGIAFWVETRPPGECSATLQAMREGCFQGAACYDASGAWWPIQTATPKRQPTILERWFPWRRVPVQLLVGTPVQVGVPEVVSRLGEVLLSGNDFCEHSLDDPVEIRRRLEAARTPGRYHQHRGRLSETGPPTRQRLRRLGLRGLSPPWKRGPVKA